jgi:hypothetical protein
MKSRLNRLARIAVACGALLMLGGCYYPYYTHPGVVYDNGYSTGAYYEGSSYGYGYAPAYYPYAGYYPYYGYGYGYYGWPFALSIGYYGGYGGHSHGGYYGGHGHYGGGGHGGGHPAPHH